jgi:hypothetical protein
MLPPLMKTIFYIMATERCVLSASKTSLSMNSVDARTWQADQAHSLELDGLALMRLQSLPGY